MRARPLGDPTPRRTTPLVHPHYARGSGDQSNAAAQRKSFANDGEVDCVELRPDLNFDADDVEQSAGHVSGSAPIDEQESKSNEEQQNYRSSKYTVDRN